MNSQISTMKEVVDFAAKSYGANPAFRYKRKKEIVTKTYEDLKKTVRR